MEAASGVRCPNTEAEDSTRTCLAPGRGRWFSCSSSKTTCGWTEEPEPCFWISPYTTETSTCFALPGENHRCCWFGETTATVFVKILLDSLSRTSLLISIKWNDVDCTEIGSTSLNTLLIVI